MTAVSSPLASNIETPASLEDGLRISSVYQGPASRSRAPGELAARTGRVRGKTTTQETSRDGASPHVVGRCAFNDRWSCAITMLTSTNRSHCIGGR